MSQTLVGTAKRGTAVITGASSGLGRELAKLLAADGWELVLVARRKDRMEQLASTLNTFCTIICADLSSTQECVKVYEQTKDMDVSLLINNAGFGVLGDFKETDLDWELSMVDTNCKALHTLMKLYLRDFVKKDRGQILNVGSVSGYLIGPLMATYYATKAYVLKLSQSVNYELLKRGSRVRVSVLCPGPFETEFNQVAGASYNISGKSAEYIARCAMKGLKRGKGVINPGALTSLAKFAVRLAPDRLIAAVCFKTQNVKKEGK